MSYIIKFQSTPAVLDSVLGRSKQSIAMYHSLTPNFHRSHLIFRNNRQELSSYVSALKTLPLKNKTAKNKENAVQSKTMDFQKVPKLLNPNNAKSVKRKSLNAKEEVIANKTEINYNFDSTKSYDPNLLDHNLEVERCFKNYGTHKTLQDAETNSSLDADMNNSQQAAAQGNLKKLKQGLSKLECDGLQRKSVFTKEDLQKLLKLNDKLKLMNNPLQHEALPSKKFLRKCVKQEYLQPSHKEKLKTDAEKQKEINFENFSSIISQYNKPALMLLSSIDIYCSNNVILKGYELMRHFRTKPIWNEIIKSETKHVLDSYNLLLHGLSEGGRWAHMKEVTRWMALDNIKMDHESFAALFYCLIKIREFDSGKLVLNQVKILLNELFNTNISPDDIFSKTAQPKEKLEKIIGLIQEAVPSFSIQPVTINLSSDCSLTKNLLLLKSNLESPVENVSFETMKNFVEEQLLLENKFLIEIESVSKGPVSHDSNIYSEKLNVLKKNWKQALENAVLKALTVNKTTNSLDPNIYIYLNSIPVDTLVNIMMEVALNLMEFAKGYSPTMAQCCFSVSRKVNYRYQIIKKQKNDDLNRTRELFNQYLSWYLNPSGPATNSRQKWQMLIQISDKMSQLESKMIRWPDDMAISFGKFLLHLIIKELKFPIEKFGEKKYYPVLYTVLRFRDGVWREEIKCHPSISKIFQKKGFDLLYFPADQIPMVCPPKPWKSAQHGGYLFLPTEFIRKSGSQAGKALIFEDMQQKTLYPTMDALNSLQGIPWTINEDVLDVALEVFRNGGSKKVNVPSYPEDVVVDKSSDFQTFEERMEARSLKKKLEKQRCEEYGLWVEALYRLSLANHFRKRLFWLPQNCDFRGRVYPVPALLNHIGSDLYRSLVLFGKGKPLGPRGLDWLKIHLVNLTGTHKQKTIFDRLTYANEILPLILDSAEKPLTGQKWWMESEEPWQTLAACYEIKKATSVSDPENYVCSFPIHQDGSCNGLQHYAGLGKDTVGARSVNLATLNNPQDVYTVVANLIESERIKDEANGVEVAKKLAGFIQRKVVKQTVMTTVYGVTAFGAKSQIAKRLEEFPNFPEEFVRPGAAYLAYKTFEVLEKMFTSAREIQEWLTKCASGICSLNDYVQWVTPLGLPVLQSYGKVHVPQYRRPIILPNKIKQKNAFPPNFIHSLDSSHMMLTALFCEQAGVSFASVHDCFWTHPNTVEKMNVICREQFISLHSQPLLENLSQFFMRQYLHNDDSNEKNLARAFEAIPVKGDFDIKEVLNSVYFFS